MAAQKLIKHAIVLLITGYCIYCSLLIYHRGVPLNFIEPEEQMSYDTSGQATKASIKESDTITLEDLFISVKTTRYYQFTRLPLILKTWFQLAKDQIWFFTDIDNLQHQNQTHGHVVNTNCTPDYASESLCCKFGYEYDFFLESNKKWFCHFDDDNYVNIPRLVAVLQKYNYTEKWYLGQVSRKPVLYRYYNRRYQEVKFSFWFATGGAGVCISRSLAIKLIPIMSNGKFASFCVSSRFSDDVSFGFIIENVLFTNMTKAPEFHSHYDQMKLLNTGNIKNQVSFSYKNDNVVNVTGFNTTYDPTRFLSLHCFLFPHFNFCPK